MKIYILLECLKFRWIREINSWHLSLTGEWNVVCDLNANKIWTNVIWILATMFGRLQYVKSDEETTWCDLLQMRNSLLCIVWIRLNWNLHVIDLPALINVGSGHTFWKTPRHIKYLNNISKTKNFLTFSTFNNWMRNKNLKISHRNQL